MSSPAKKIKILHVVDLSKTGGVEVMFMQFLSKIIASRSDFEHAVFALRITEERKEALLDLGIKVYAPKDNSYNLIRRLTIIKFIANEHYDIVHGQNYSGNLWATIGSYFQIRPVKLLSHEHGGSWGAEGIHRVLSNFWARNSNLVICNSKAAKKIIKTKIYNKAKLKLIYNGVSKTNFVNNNLRHKDSFSILYVGRLEKVKGVKDLVSSLKILHDLDIDFCCNILGDGQMREWIVSQIVKHNLTKKVIIHGVVNNVDQFMANSDILVLPSIREPLGNVIIEAAHHNLPTIASNIDGIKEIDVHNSTGILLSPKLACATRGLPKHVIGEFGELTSPMAIDPNELAEELIKLKNNPDLRKKYGLSANKLLKDFTIEYYTEQISQTYMEL